MSAASTLQLDLKPSLRLAGLLLAVHALALVAACVSLAGWPRVLVGFGVLLSGAGCLAEVLQRSPRAAVALELREDGGASWRDLGGAWHEGRLRSDHFVSAVLVVMGLDVAGHGRKWLVLLGDSALPEDFRRLRVWLRWRRDVGSGRDRTRASPE
ncbi:MAG TPA: protein YgfX [Burkholderiales bacterium]|nr:protein YgfX [Burkholderiales bacterium]